jgi:hypothetical protein
MAVGGKPWQSFDIFSFLALALSFFLQTSDLSLSDSFLIFNIFLFFVFSMTK